ncbi:NADH:flavin oxidoreductase/NADH oxidase [Massilia niastensis]|uniref:NADH:flavin oxidoreductase/NADH oxidase n=1 Tax=Massilia niastensis TaxID=544911 RepID=UPI000367E144|nr:NADH:flavin oxidoreductase/NADH oxidase [Massilia niastensis]
MSTLFSPVALGPLTLENRITIAPMCQYSSEHGLANDWHLIHLGHLALSGAAMLTLEATAVSPEGRISSRDLGIWGDEHAAALAPVVASVRRHSPIRLAIQLAHAGRKASSRVPWEGGMNIPLSAGGWQTVGPSAQPYAPGDTVPVELDAAGLRKVLDDFVDAARRSAALGFDAIEVHAAHGYLLHQFLSPLSNQRTDSYGGSLENRMRFPLEVFKAVREAAPGTVAVGIRISATDWADGGWDLEQSVAFARALRRAGSDFIHVSSGGLAAQQQITVAPGYQVPFAQRIKDETGMPTIAVGMITQAQQAEEIVASGKADVVALARAIVFNPRWPWLAAVALGAHVQAPRQYWRSPREFRHLYPRMP